MVRSRSVKRNLYRPRLPLHLRAWNIFLGDSRASQRYIIRHVLRSAAAGNVTVAAHFPTGDSKIGMPVLDHSMMDVYADEERIGLLNSHYPAFQYGNQGISRLTLRSFQTDAKLVQIDLVPGDDRTLVLHVSPSRDWWPLPSRPKDGRYKWVELRGDQERLVQCGQLPVS